MDYWTFEDFQRSLQALYEQQDYDGALELATEQFENFPEQFHLLYYWRFTMAARTGNKALALALLQEVAELGFWYGEDLLRKSPSLGAFQGEASFERLVELNNQLRQEEQNRLFPLITLRAEGSCRSGGPGCPLLVGLHGNGSTAHRSVDFWRPAASSGWLVAVPQSSQAIWKGAYVWNDRDLAKQEILRKLEALQKQYAISPPQPVLAGHDAGGELAIWLAITGAAPARGFIAIAPNGPWIEQLENWDTILHAAHGKALRGYVILGEEDPAAPVDRVAALVDMINEVDIDVELEMVPHAGHDYDEAYESSLLRALEYIQTEAKDQPPGLR